MFKALFSMLLVSFLFIQCSQENVSTEEAKAISAQELEDFKVETSLKAPCLKFPTLSVKDYPGAWTGNSTPGADYADAMKSALQYYNSCINNPTTEWCGGSYKSGGSMTTEIRYCSGTNYHPCTNEDGEVVVLPFVPTTFNPQTFVQDALNNAEAIDCGPGCIALPVGVSVEDDGCSICTCGIWSPHVNENNASEIPCSFLETQSSPLAYNGTLTITIDYMCCCVGPGPGGDGPSTF